MLKMTHSPDGIPETSCLIHEHRAGSCIVSEEPVIVRPQDNRSGSAAPFKYLYWLSCDGRYRNALREELTNRNADDLEKYERPRDSQGGDSRDWTVIEQLIWQNVEDTKWPYGRSPHEHAICILTDGRIPNKNRIPGLGTKFLCARVRGVQRCESSE